MRLEFGTLSAASNLAMYGKGRSRRPGQMRDRQTDITLLQKNAQPNQQRSISHRRKDSAKPPGQSTQDERSRTTLARFTARAQLRETASLRNYLERRLRWPQPRSFASM